MNIYISSPDANVIIDQQVIVEAAKTKFSLAKNQDRVAKMECASARAGAPTGAPAGTFSGFERAADFYFTSEEPIKKIFEFTAMCAISTTDRVTFNINPTPDPAAVFPDELTQPITGNNFGGITGASPVFFYDQVLAFVDDQKIPLFITDFPSATSATSSSGIIGSFVGTSFNGNTTGIYRTVFTRVALNPSSLGTWAGGAQKTLAIPCDESNVSASIIIKACFIPFNPDLAGSGRRARW